MVSLVKGLGACHFEVAGLFDGEQDSVLRMNEYVQSNFLEHPRISLYGAPNYPWNSGRPSHFVGTREGLEECIRSVSVRGIGSTLVATNFLCDESHLGDKTGNWLLSCLDKYKVVGNPNSVVCCDVLSRHVASVYPTMSRIASILQITKMMHEGMPALECYAQLFDSYDKVVLHPDHVSEQVLGSSIIQNNKSRAVVLVNETCVANCRTRHDHYVALAQAALSPRDMDAYAGATTFQATQCGAIPYPRCLRPEWKPARLSRTVYESLISDGFVNFKIQGRSAMPTELWFDLCYYLFDEASFIHVYRARYNTN